MQKDIKVHECRKHVINCSSAGFTLSIIKFTEFYLGDVKLESKIILNDQIE